MSKPSIIVTGVGGQLGWSIQKLSHQFPQYDFTFIDQQDLDLSKPETIEAFFQKHKPDYFIHCAAYTAVDKAETEQELAYNINALSTGEIAKECARIGAKLIAISTDYVFNGNGTSPYKPDEATDPLNYYGYSKWMGEKLALENNPGNTVIIRTSWVYCEHGNNFVKTMLRLMKERDTLKVVGDQVGSPTYAPDLAAAILRIVGQWNEQLPGYPVYHFSNDGVISWFDFATGIRDIAGLNCEVLSIPSSDYPTPAKRPFYSVMDKTSIVQDWAIELTDWKESLTQCIAVLKSTEHTA